MLMPSILNKSAFLCLIPMGAAAGNDPALLGCWRSQQVEVTFADQSHTNQNGDCVVEYDATQARSRCHNETGEVKTVSNYELLGPGQLRVTVVDTATGAAKGPPSELHYRIEDKWLLIDRQFPAAAPSSNTNKQPISFKSVSVREDGADKGASRCEPRGETGLRVGRTPRSSLALKVPSGWKPYLVDPVTNKELALAVNTNLFIGAFKQSEEKSSAPSPNTFVFLIDDARSGPMPVRAAEFDAVKKRFAEERTAQELGTFQVTCNRPDRVCASLHRPDGGFVYTELVNVKGRVVMISAASTSLSASDAAGALPKYVGTFVEQLRSDNAP
jgi:hypothetical protein